MKKYKIVTPKGECLGNCVVNGTVSELNHKFYTLSEFSCLNLTLEEIVPVKRKAFAFVDDQYAIHLKTHESFATHDKLFRRAPEYDINYDDNK